MTNQTKCKIANGIQTTGRIIGPTILVSSVLTLAVIVITSFVRIYRAHPIDFYKDLLGFVLVITTYVVLMCVVQLVGNFVDRYRNTDCSKRKDTNV